MFLLFSLLTFFVCAGVAALLLVVCSVPIRERFRGPRPVTCPENHQPVAVSFDVLHATLSGLTGDPLVCLADCTRWPERGQCDQACIPEALRAVPYTKNEIEPPISKPIYHLPIFIAAFAGWLLGAWWHSEYLFRARWMNDFGLSDATLRQIVEWYSPQFLTLLAPLLFAYGVAWMLQRSDWKGIFPGMVCATVAWGALMAVILTSRWWVGIPTDVLRLEAGYTFLASGLMGAIIGGLEGKLVMQTFEAGKEEISRLTAKPTTRLRHV
jgi:hypothetical protein